MTPTCGGGVGVAAWVMRCDGEEGFQGAAWGFKGAGCQINISDTGDVHI